MLSLVMYVFAKLKWYMPNGYVICCLSKCLKVQDSSFFMTKKHPKYDADFIFEYSICCAFDLRAASTADKLRYENLQVV